MLNSFTLVLNANTYYVLAKIVNINAFSEKTFSIRFRSEHTFGLGSTKIYKDKELLFTNKFQILVSSTQFCSLFRFINLSNVHIWNHSHWICPLFYMRFFSSFVFKITYEFAKSFFIVDEMRKKLSKGEVWKIILKKLFVDRFFSKIAFSFCSMHFFRGNLSVNWRASCCEINLKKTKIIAISLKEWNLLESTMLNQIEKNSDEK